MRQTQPAVTRVTSSPRPVSRHAHSMHLREGRSEDVEGCVAVLTSLPEYFTPSTHDDVRRELPIGMAWIAEENGAVVGFLLASRRYPRAAEITFAAVVPDRRNQGVG